MKSKLKYSLNLCLIATALVLASCGKKENKVSSISGSTPFYTGNSAFSTSAGSTIISQVQSIKSNVSCPNGYYGGGYYTGTRLTNDVSFYVQNGVVGTNRIGGNWQQGFLTNGTVNKLWIGVSAYRDIMFVTQVVSGSQVVGFNATMSFCEMKSAPGMPSIIANDRSYTAFAAPSGIIVDSNTYCGYSVVDLAQNTQVYAQPYMSLPAAVIPTSYTKPTCNGQF